MCECARKVHRDVGRDLGGAVSPHAHSISLSGCPPRSGIAVLAFRFLRDQPGWHYQWISCSGNFRNLSNILEFGQSWTAAQRPKKLLPPHIEQGGSHGYQQESLLVSWLAPQHGLKAMFFDRFRPYSSYIAQSQLNRACDLPKLIPIMTKNLIACLKRRALTEELFEVFPGSWEEHHTRPWWTFRTATPLKEHCRCLKHCWSAVATGHPAFQCSVEWQPLVAGSHGITDSCFPGSC